MNQMSDTLAEAVMVTHGKDSRPCVPAKRCSLPSLRAVGAPALTFRAVVQLPLSSSRCCPVASSVGVRVRRWVAYSFCQVAVSCMLVHAVCLRQAAQCGKFCFCARFEL